MIFTRSFYSFGCGVESPASLVESALAAGQRTFVEVRRQAEAAALAGIEVAPGRLATGAQAVPQRGQHRRERGLDAQRFAADRMRALDHPGVQRLAGQLKAAESRNVEINHWADKLRNELQLVRTQLDDEIRLRQEAEGRIRGMESQLPEIRRLFDAIEHQVDGLEDSLMLEEERTQRLNESLDSLVASIGDVFARISARLLASQRAE